MTATMQSLGLDRLSKDERLNLMDQLWESIDAEEDSLSSSHLQDLEERLEKYRDNPLVGSTWEVVMSRMNGAVP